jgi:hypothetical protein
MVCLLVLVVWLLTFVFFGLAVAVVVGVVVVFFKVTVTCAAAAAAGIDHGSIALLLQLVRVGIAPAGRRFCAGAGQRSRQHMCKS